MSNSFENPSTNAGENSKQEVDQVNEALSKILKESRPEGEILKNTFTPEGWFIHEAKGTETMEEVQELPEFKDSNEEEIKALFEKYSDKFNKDTVKLEKAI